MKFWKMNYVHPHYTIIDEWKSVTKYHKTIFGNDPFSRGSHAKQMEPLMLTFWKAFTMSTSDKFPHGTKRSMIQIIVFITFSMIKKS